MTRFKKQLLLAFIAGLSAVFSFAPFDLFSISMIAQAILFILWHEQRHRTQAALTGFVFGLGFFLSGIGWIYVALNVYGGMIMPLAALATLLFAAFLALFPALCGWLQHYFRLPPVWQLLLVFPALWVSMEWVRGLIFTGFPWLTLGYAHSDSPLAGFAPILGVYGVSLLASLCAALLALIWLRQHDRFWTLPAFLAVWIIGIVLSLIHWTTPAGNPVKTTLIQGNIDQKLKFQPEQFASTLQHYLTLMQQHPAALTVLPETAIPTSRRNIPDEWLQAVQQHAVKQQGNVIIGAFLQQHDRFYNGAFSVGQADTQEYLKYHLVPFGEFIPFRTVLGPFINQVLGIPMGDLGRGADWQPPMQLNGQSFAVNICYEDVFGEELIDNAVQATVLINMTNDAWYGRSHAAAQHNQIARMRALETGRMMLRATNTGVTSIINPQGQVIQQLPQHQSGVLTADIQGHTGLTPYMRWGNALVIALLLIMLCSAVLQHRRTTRQQD